MEVWRGQGEIPSTAFRDPDAWGSRVGLKLSRRMAWVWGLCRRRGLRNKAFHVWGETHIWTFHMASSCIYIEAEHGTSVRETFIDSQAWAANTSSPHSPQGKGLLSPAYPNPARKLAEFLPG